MIRIGPLAAALLVGLAGAAGARQPCAQGWSTLHQNPEVLHPGYGGDCIKPLTFDGKTVLYQSGCYWEDAGGVMTWEDGWWRDIVARKIDHGQVGSYDLARFDDGNGPTLYGMGYPNGPDGGLMVPRDGSWEVVLPVRNARTLAVWDAGQAPGLYFGGYFREVDGQEALYIGRWDGKNWSTVGGGMGYVPGQVSPGVTALRVWDDGTGPALYAGGRFDTAGGVPAVSIARWDGAKWTALGDPLLDKLIDNTQPLVLCFTDHDDGSGPALYVGGNFQGTPGIASSSVMKWDGHGWHGMDGGLKTSIYPQYGDAFVYALEWFDDGSGEKLYAGGHITKTADGRQVNFIARWDGKTWEPVGGGMSGPVHALRSFDDGRGPTLWVGGESELADGQGVWDGYWISEGGWKHTGAVARYDKNGWHRPNTGGMDQDVHALLARRENGKEVVYAGGEFFAAGDGRRQGFARFDGTAWQDVGDWKDLGTEQDRWYRDGIYALAALPGDDGIYASVHFHRYHGGPYADGVARFDGEHWSWLGELSFLPHALAVHDDGNGPRLYAGTEEGGNAGGVYRFDDQAWEKIGQVKGSNGAVAVLSTVDDPGAPGVPTLYAAGQFKTINGLTAHDIARWDGQAWSSVGDAEFTWPDATAAILAVASFDAGDGPKVYAGGTFQLMNGKPCTLAAWDGAAWHVVSKDPGQIRFARVMDLGDGPALYIGGDFDSVAGVHASSLIRLTAEGQWEDVDPTGEGFRFAYYQGEGSGYILDLALFNDPVSGPSLMAAGRFESAGGISSGNVAQLFLCAGAPCPADLDSSGSLDLFDFLTFLNLFKAGDPSADCDADGALTLADFTCYTTLFAAGCP